MSLLTQGRFAAKGATGTKLAQIKCAQRLTRIAQKIQLTARPPAFAPKHVDQQALERPDIHAPQWPAANDCATRCFGITKHVEKREIIGHPESPLLHHQTIPLIVDCICSKESQQIMATRHSYPGSASTSRKYYLISVSLFVILVASPLFQADQHAASYFLSLFGRNAVPRSARTVLAVPGLARKTHEGFVWDLNPGNVDAGSSSDGAYIDLSIMQLHSRDWGYYVPSSRERVLLIHHNDCLSSGDIAQILLSAKTAIETETTDPRYHELATMLALPGYSTTTVLWKGVVANVVSLMAVCLCIWCLIFGRFIHKE